MSTPVIMPQMGESIAEGTITKWLKKVGDPIKRDEPIFEISTDKVDAEIPSPVAGTLLEIKVQEGATVAINTVVAVDRRGRREGGEAPAPAPAQARRPTGPRPRLGAAGRPRRLRLRAPAPAAAAPPVATAPKPAAPPPAAPSPAATRESAPADAPGGQVESIEERIRRPVVAPRAQDRAGEPDRHRRGRRHGDPQPRDEERHPVYLENRKVAGPAPSRAATAPAEMPGRAEPAAPPEPSAPPRPSISVTDRDEVVAMTKIRRITAENMILSKRTSAHVTTVFQVDYTNVSRLRAKHKDAFLEKNGVKLTYLPFIFRASIQALKEFPQVNASIDAENIVYHKDVHLGMAVALDWGLIVPVIKNADEKSILGLARASQDLAERARTKRLKPEEIQGGTFTVTNPGVFGSLFGTPIIPQPQVAILGVGTIEKRPVVVTDENGADALGIRTVGYLRSRSTTADRRRGRRQVHGEREEDARGRRVRPRIAPRTGRAPPRAAPSPPAARRNDGALKDAGEMATG
jgi:2-oxoglutarate dehydrogenase E2 component (dihydrolipoamide succinyltransferase)